MFTKRQAERILKEALKRKLNSQGTLVENKKIRIGYSDLVEIAKEEQIESSYLDQTIRGISERKERMKKRIRKILTASFISGAILGAGFGVYKIFDNYLNPTARDMSGFLEGTVTKESDIINGDYNYAIIVRTVNGDYNLIFHTREDISTQQLDLMIDQGTKIIFPTKYKPHGPIKKGFGKMHPEHIEILNK